MWAVVLFPALLCAQSFRGTIRGQVLDASGARLAGAKVSAKNNATGLTRETVTGPDGSYVMAELPAGIYAVMAQATGLSPVAQNVVVNVGLDTTANFDVTSVEKQVEKVTVSGSEWFHAARRIFPVSQTPATGFGITSNWFSAAASPPISAWSLPWQDRTMRCLATPSIMPA